MNIFVEREVYHEETLYPLVREFSRSSEDLLFAQRPFLGEEMLESLNCERHPCKFWRVLKQVLFSKGVDHLYVNTLERASLFLIVLIAGIRGIPVSAIAHNLGYFYDCDKPRKANRKERLLSWPGRRLIEPILDRVYVLDQRVIEQVEGLPSKVEVFSTALLNQFPSPKLLVPEVPENCTVLAILGDISYKRRDYGCLEELKAEFLHRNHIRLLFLGNVTQIDGPDWRKKLIGKEVEPYCVFFENHLSYAELFAWLKRSDAVLNVKRKSYYGMGKVSSAEHLAASFDRPCWDVSEGGLKLSVENAVNLKKERKIND